MFGLIPVSVLLGFGYYKVTLWAQQIILDPVNGLFYTAYDEIMIGAVFFCVLSAGLLMLLIIKYEKKIFPSEYSYSLRKYKMSVEEYDNMASTWQKALIKGLLLGIIPLVFFGGFSGKYILMHNNTIVVSKWGHIGGSQEFSLESIQRIEFEDTIDHNDDRRKYYTFHFNEQHVRFEETVRPIKPLVDRLTEETGVEVIDL